MGENNNRQPEVQMELSEILQVRRDKLASLREEGRDPFRQTRFERSAYSQEIKDDCVVAKNVKTGEVKEIKADTVLLAMGIKPRFDVVDALRHSCPETSVAIVGDCNNKAGTISEAVNQAFQACIHI